MELFQRLDTIHMNNVHKAKLYLLCQSSDNDIIITITRFSAHKFNYIEPFPLKMALLAMSALCQST